MKKTKWPHVARCLALFACMSFVSFSSAWAQVEKSELPAQPAAARDAAPSITPTEDGVVSQSVTAEPPSGLSAPAPDPALSEEIGAELGRPEIGEAAPSPRLEGQGAFLGTEPSDGVQSEDVDAVQEPATATEEVERAVGRATKFLRDGGPSIWAIAALSVVTVALILWKVWRLALIGAWSRGKARKAVVEFEQGDAEAALAIVQGRFGLRSRVVTAAINSRMTLPEEAAREETSRVAKYELGEAGTGLRALELIATIAPLLGLLGTVLGMIAAFQALQESGSQADPSQLAGGIWEALLTTAAGMAVAIPASAALTWFEAVIDRMRRDVEDAAMRIFVYQRPSDKDPTLLAAE